MATSGHRKPTATCRYRYRYKGNDLCQNHYTALKPSCRTGQRGKQRARVKGRFSTAVSIATNPDMRLFPNASLTGQAWGLHTVWSGAAVGLPPPTAAGAALLEGAAPLFGGGPGRAPGPWGLAGGAGTADLSRFPEGRRRSAASPPQCHVGH